MDNPTPPNMPPPWMMPPYIMTTENPVFDNRIPARVQLAAEYSSFMARRVQPHITVNSIQVDVTPATELTAAEEKTWDAACLLLHDYFRGQMDLDQFEENRDEAVHIEMDHKRLGQLHNCRCTVENDGQQIPADPNCVICKGCGQVLIIPTRRQ